MFTVSMQFWNTSYLADANTVCHKVQVWPLLKPEIKRLLYKMTLSAGLCLFDPVFMNDWWTRKAAAFLWIVHEAWTQSSDLSSSLWRCLPLEAAQSRSSLSASSPGQISPLIYSYSTKGRDKALCDAVSSGFSASSLLLLMSLYLISLWGIRVWLSLQKPKQGKLLSCKCNTLRPYKHVPNSL